MAQEIDEKVVKIEFDNKEFDKKCKESIDTIEKLKKSLNFDGVNKGFDLFKKKSKDFTMNDIGGTLDQLEKRFSAFGIAGMTSIEEITKSALNLGKTLASKVMAPLNQAASGGWSRAMNIKDAKFALKGLNIVGKDLEAIMDDVSYAVDGAAFGLDAAAKAASQFAASGVGIGDEMKVALRSVTGVATQTNSTYEDISSIFTTVAANGKLMTQQLRQLSFRGLNATAKLAEALGTTEAEISDMVTKGQIDFQTFAQVMDDAFGAHAKEANETFSGALANMKSALSRIGENFADPLIDHERDVFNRIRDILNSLNKGDLERALQNYADNNEKTLDEVIDMWNNYQITVEDIQSNLFSTENSEEWIENAGSIKRLADTVNPIMQSIRDKFVDFLEDSDTFRAANNFIDGVNNAIKAFKEIGTVAKRAWRQVFPERETTIIAELTDRFKAFTKEMMLSKEGLEDAQGAFRGLFSILKFIGDAFKGFFTIVGKVAKPAMTVLIKMLGLVGDAFMYLYYVWDVFKVTIQYVKEYFSQANETIGGTTNILTDLISIAKLVGKKIKQFLGTTVTLVVKGLALAVGLVAAAFMKLREQFIKLEPLWEAARNFIKSLAELIDNRMKSISEKVFGTQNVFVGFGEAIGKVVGKVISTFNKLTSKATDFLNNMSEKFQSLKKPLGEDALKQTVENAKNNARLAKEEMKTFTGDIAGNVDNMKEEIETSTKGLSKNENKILNNIKDNTTSTIDKIKDKAGDLKDNSKQFIEFIKDAFKDLGEKMKKAKTSLDDFFSNITWQKVKQLGVIMALTAISIGVSKLLFSMGDLATSVSGLTNSISGLVKAITSKFRPVKTFQTKMIELATSIVMVTGAIYVLSELPTDNLIKAAIAVGVITTALLAIEGALMGMAFALKRMGLKEEFWQLGVNMIAFAASVLLVSVAMKALMDAVDTKDPNWQDKMLYSMLDMVVIMITMASSLALMNGFKPQIVAGSFALILFATAMQKIIKAFNELDASQADHAIKIALVLVGVIATMSMIFAAISRLKKEEKGAKKVKESLDTALMVGVILAVSVAVKATVSLFKQLMKVDWSKGAAIIKQYAVYLLAVAGLCTVFAIFGLTGKGSLRSAAISMGLLLVCVSLSLAVLARTAELLHEIEPGMLNKIIIFTALMMGLLLAMQIVTQLTDWKKNDTGVKAASRMFVGFAAAMLIMAAAMHLAAAIDTADIGKALGVMTAFSLMISLMTFAAGGLQLSTPNAWKTVIALAGAIGLLMAELLIVAQFDLDHIWKALGVMSIIMAEFTAMIYFSTAKLGNLKGTAIGVLLIYLGVVGVLFGLLEALAQFKDPNRPLKAALGMAAVMVAFGVMFAIVTKTMEHVTVDQLLPGIVALIPMLGAMALLCVAIAKLSKYDPTKLISASLGMAAVMIAFGVMTAAVMAVSTLVGTGGLASLVGLGITLLGMIALVAIVVGVVEAIGALMGQAGSNFENNVVRFGDFCELLGEAIGRAIAGFQSGMSSSGPKIADNLNKTIEAIAPAMEKIAEFKESKAIDGAKILAETMQIMVDTVNDSLWKGDPFKDMAEEFVPLSGAMEQMGIGLNKYYSQISGIKDWDQAERASKATKTIAEAFSTAPKQGGLWGVLFGTENLDKFAKSLGSIGEGISKWAEKVADIESFRKSSKACSVISEIARAFAEIPSSGGMWQSIVGGKEYTKFASSIESVATGLVAFTTASEGLEGKEKLAKSASDILVTLAEACSQVPDFKFMERITEVTDISAFAGNLDELGAGMVKFANTVNEATEEEFDKAGKAAMGIGFIINAVNSIDKPSDISTLATELKTFGKKFGDFYESIAWIGPSSAYVIDEFVAEITKLGNLDNELSGLQFMGFSALSKDLVGLNGTSFSKFTTDITSSMETALQAAIDTVKNNAVNFRQQGKDIWEEFLNGFKRGSSDTVWSDVVREVFTVPLKTALKEAESDFKEIGKNAVQGVTAGMTDANAVAEVSKAGAKTYNAYDMAFRKEGNINSPSKAMYENALWCMRGLVNGTNASLGTVAQAGTDMADAFLYDGFREELGIHSASEELKKAIAWCKEGIMNGVSKYLPQVKQAGANFGSGFLEGFQNDGFLGGLKNAIESVVPASWRSGEDLFGQLKDALGLGDNDGIEDLLGDAEDLEDAFEDIGSTGSDALGGLGGSASSAKWEFKDLLETLGLLLKAIHEGKSQYVGFSNSLEKMWRAMDINNHFGKISTNYIASAFKDANIRKAMDWSGNMFTKELNKQLKKVGKNLKPQQYYKAAAKIVKQFTKTVNAATEHMYKDLRKMGGKQLKKIASGITEFTNSYINQFIKSDKSIKSLSKSMIKTMGVTAKRAKRAYGNLGNYLYYKSDQYKNDKKNLNSYSKQYSKIMKKVKKQRDILMNPKSTAQQKQDAKSELSSLVSQLTTVKSNLKKIGKTIANGPNKYIKQLRKEIKQMIKDYLKFVDLEPTKVIGDYFDKMKKANPFLDNVSENFSKFTTSIEKNKDVFGLWNVEATAGISLLEDFTKQSTTTARRLMFNAKSNLKAYDEFYEGIQKMYEMGFNKDFVRSLEEQGVSALGTVRGFIKMDEEQRDAYNDYLEEVAKRDAHATAENLKKQSEAYKDYYALLDRLREERGISNGVYEYLKEEGPDKKDMVEALLGMDENDFQQTVWYLLESALVDAPGADAVANSFLDSLNKSFQKKSEWEDMLKKLKNSGVSDILYSYLEEQGYEGGYDTVKEILDGGIAAIQDYNDAFANATGFKNPIESWLESMTENVSIAKRYNTVMTKLQKELSNSKQQKMLYDYIANMGTEEGLAYAEAYLAADEAGRQKIRAAFNKEQKLNAENIGLQLQQKVQNAKMWASDLKILAKNGMSSTMLQELIEAGPSEFAYVRELAQLASSGELKSLVEGYDEAMTTAQSLAKKTTDALALAVDKEVQAAVKAATDKKNINELTTAFSTLIKEATNGTNMNLSKKQGEALAKKLRTAYKNIINKDGGTVPSTNFVKGVVQGLNNGKSSVKQAAKSLAETLYKQFNSTLKVKSPSRVAIETAEYFDEGVIVGLENKADDVERSGDTLGKSLVSTFADAVAIMRDTVDQNEFTLGFTDTISTSGIMAQVNDLRSQLNGVVSMNLDINRNANKDVVAALNEMSKDVQSQYERMEEVISNMEVVMDSGALVGAIVEPMDKAMGQRVARAKRRY